MKTLLALIFLCAVNVQGQILIYKMTISSTDVGFGFTTKLTAPGYFVVDTATGAAAEFVLYPREKEYSFRSKTFTVRTVHGGRGRDYMVFAEAVADTDTYGPYRISSTAKGVTLSLDVGLIDNRPVPRTMRLVGHYVFNLGLESLFAEDAGTLAIDLPGTRSANSAGHTFDDSVTTIRSNLADRGYRDNRPPG